MLGGVERVVASVTGAVRVSLFAWALGPRDYGLYLVILGFVAAANLLDFGVHFGALSAIASASGRDDRAEIARITSTAFFVYLRITVRAALLLTPLAKS